MKLGQAIATVIFTSMATIGRDNPTGGTGYRMAAVIAAILCGAASVILNFYNEKKVMATLEQQENA